MNSSSKSLALLASSSGVSEAFISSTLRTLPGVDIVDKQPSMRGGSGWTYGVGAVSYTHLYGDTLPVHNELDAVASGYINAIAKGKLSKLTPV